mgnify:CR=1 FL=1
MNILKIANKYCDALEIVIYEIKDEMVRKIENSSNKQIETLDLSDPSDLFKSELIQIILNALVKMAIKFKEFMPKCVLIFSKIL